MRTGREKSANISGCWFGPGISASGPRFCGPGPPITNRCDVRRPIPIPIRRWFRHCSDRGKHVFSIFQNYQRTSPYWFRPLSRLVPRVSQVLSPRISTNTTMHTKTWSIQVHPLVFPSSPGSAKKHPPPPHRCATRGGGPRAPGGRFSWHMDLFSLSWSMA